MKRAVIAIVLLAAMVAICVSSIVVLTKMTNDFIADFENLTAIAESGDKEKTVFEAKRLTELWVEKHHTICRIVRHTQIDQVTLAVARFEPLARHGEIGELTAELKRCCVLLEDIWDAELPLLRNII